MRKLGVVALAAWIVASATVSAQEPATRAEADRQRRADKESSTTPYEQGGLERAFHFAEDRAIFIVDREGFYPKFGSLTTGSGFAYGVGFRDRDLFSNKGTLDIWTAGTTRLYWAAEIRFAFPRLAGNRLLLESWASRRDYPREMFFGLGPDAAREDQSDYAIRTNHFGGRGGFRPFPLLLVGGSLERQTPVVGTGENDRIPNLEDVFAPEDVPGFGESADFLRSSAFVEVDYRVPRNPRQGGWYRVNFAHYTDRTLDRYSFNRIDVDLRQFLGFLAGRRVIALRTALSTSDTDDANVMPFYYMPTLGGNDTLRGFREYRYRGPHAILAQAEYRWEIWSGLDAALFYDAGKVAERRADLDFENLEHDYGFGFRFNTNESIVFRVDAGFGSRDGKHLYIVWGGVF
jgi:hypothetical protein